MTLAGRDDPPCHRGGARSALHGDQLERFRTWVGPLRERHGEILVHAENSAALLGAGRARFDMARCGGGVYGLDPFGGDPAALGSSRRSSCAPGSPRGSPAPPGESAGYGRRFIAARDRAGGRADRLRRRGPARALRERRGADRRSAPSGCRHGQHGQPDGRSRRRQRCRGGGGGRSCSAPRATSAISAEELAARQGTINYEITCAVSPRVPRRYHRDGGERGMTRRTGALGADARDALARTPGAGSSAGRFATSCVGAPPSTDIDLVSSMATSRGGSADSARRPRRVPPSRSPTSSARGASSAPGTPGRPTSIRCAADRIEADLALRDFTVNAIARPLGRRASWSIRSAGSRTSAGRRLRIVAPVGDRGRSAARIAARALCLRARSRARRAGARGGDGRGRTGLAAVASRARLRRAAADRRGRARSSDGDAPAARARLRAAVLPELEALAASSRATTTTSTSSTTRSRCSSALVELERDPGGCSAGASPAGVARAARRAAGRRAVTRRHALRFGALLPRHRQAGRRGPRRAGRPRRLSRP